MNRYAMDATVIYFLLRRLATRRRVRKISRSASSSHSRSAVLENLHGGIESLIIAMSLRKKSDGNDEGEHGNWWLVHVWILWVVLVVMRFNEESGSGINHSLGMYWLEAPLPVVCLIRFGFGL